ncbi:MAG: Lrp/AsnC family transcriptional regulator [Hoeflea sp.]|nr:Lrp/AsnC family transcriptional regulator [Hoeflea sp.]
MQDNHRLDAADRKLLDLLQTNARMTIEALSEAAGLSSSATHRRVQRLRELKIIQGDISVLDPRKLGNPITLLVELELERDRPELMPALQAWISATASVQQAWQVTGRGDLVLVVVASSVEDFDSLAEQMMEQNRNIRKFTTSVALKTLKRGLRLPVPQAG